MSEYVPSVEDMENRYVLWSLNVMDFQPEDREAWAEKLRAEFLRGLARVRRDAAEAAVKRVREMHVPQPHGPGQCDPDGCPDLCQECGERMPCTTVRTLDDDS